MKCWLAGIFCRMMTLLGTIGSLAVVLILIVAAVLLISAVGMVVLLTMAASMTRWRRLWRRLTRGEARLALKLSDERAPERRRAELSGVTPRVRRRFLLGGARPRRPGGGDGNPWGSRFHHRPLERHTRT